MRIDNFADTHFNKLEWCFKLGQEHGCELALGPGDIFHSPRASDDTKRRFQDILKRNDNIHFLGIFGQHDVYHYRNDLRNTPLGVVESSGLIEILDNQPYNFDDVYIYGASWNEPIPEILNKKAFNVLVIHKMIIKEDELYPGQENYFTARMILAKNSFDLIVSGDNHSNFTSEYNGKTLLNMGSLCRMTTAQLNHEPQVAIFDTDTKTYELFKIPIEPPENVFNLEEVEKAKKHKDENGKIKDYIDILSQEAETREWDFVGNLDKFLKSNGIKGSVDKIIKSTLVEA